MRPALAPGVDSANLPPARGGKQTTGHPMSGGILPGPPPHPC